MVILWRLVLLMSEVPLHVAYSRLRPRTSPPPIFDVGTLIQRGPNTDRFLCGPLRTASARVSYDRHKAHRPVSCATTSTELRAFLDCTEFKHHTDRCVCGPQTALSAGLPTVLPFLPSYLSSFLLLNMRKRSTDRKPSSEHKLMR